MKEEKEFGSSGKKKGQCSQRDRCSFRHETQARAQKPEHTAATPSEPTVSRDRSVSRKRSIQGKSNPGAILRRPCRVFFLNCTCTRTSCEYWHPPGCHFYKMKPVVRMETSVCFRITRLMNNKIKKPKKATSQKEETAMTRMLWLFTKVYQNWVVCHKIQMHSFLKVVSLGETRCRKSWNQFKGYDSQSQRCVMRVSGKRKDPPARRGTLPKNINKLKVKVKPTFYSPSEEWVLSVTSIEEPEEREFVVDSGASMHMVSKKDVNSAELETMRTSRSPTTVMTANGEVQTREEATENVKQLDLFVKDMLLEETPAVLSLGKLGEDHGSSYHWTSGQKPHLIRIGKRIDCNIFNYVPFVVTGISTSSSSTTPTPTSPSSSSQDSVFDVNRYTENPVPERSGSTSGELRGDPLHESTETENKNKNGESEEVQRDISHELPDWLQEFRENLVDECTSTEPWGKPRARIVKTLPSHLMNLPMEPRAKVEPRSGKHSVYTHFPKDPHCEICLKTKITRASYRRRAGTVVPRAEHFGDLITVDHKILSEGSESRNNHRYAVVVQDLATQWLQSYPCKTKTSQETQKSLMKFLEPTRKPKVIYTENSLEFDKSCEELSRNHRTSTPHRSETYGIAERAIRRVKEGKSAVLLLSGLDNDRWADSLECYCCLRNIQDKLSDGKTPYERRFGMPFNGPAIPFGAKVEYHPISAKDQSRLHQFGAKVYQECFSVTHCTWEESGKETLWLQTLKNSRRWTHQNSTPEGSMQRNC